MQLPYRKRRNLVPTAELKEAAKVEEVAKTGKG